MISRSEWQEEERLHRLAYIVQDGDVTEEEAHRYMDSKPWLYGVRESQGQQVGFDLNQK